jgi:PAS domain S-box-containing protein
MATPIMRAHQETAQLSPERAKETFAGGAASSSLEPVTSGRRRSVSRLLIAENSEEIYPVLLEEILALGFTRALIASADFETATLRPIAALNCPRTMQERFRLPLWADHPVIQTLHSRQPAIVSLSRNNSGRKFYVHPMMFASSRPCWEAQREHRSDCLLVLNQTGGRRLNLNEQSCTACEMRGYASVIVVEVPARGMERERAEMRNLIGVANRFLMRLYKVEHYFNRMRDQELAIDQMQTVMQSMPDPVILTDSQHRVILQNRAAERFFNLPEEVTEGRAHAVELNNMLFTAALSSLAVSDVESSRDLTLVDAIEGEEVLFEAVCAPLVREGLRAGMVTVMRDVTDLRRADEELRANYEKLRNAEELVRQDRDRLNLIVENVGDPIVVCDRSAKFFLLDPLALELFGADEVGGRSAEQLKNLAKFDAYISSFTFAFSHKESAPLRLYKPSAQNEVEFDARSGKIYDERGQVSFTVTVLRDFTALRKLEQMKMERRMLEMEKFAATGRLAGTIAHEVNNPMEAIKNAIFLLESGLKPDATPIYDILKKETERVARIVRQMLSLYRHSEQVSTVDLNAIVEDSLALFARQLERSNVQVSTELDKLPGIVGSPDQFRQVVSNLLVNARDSMASNGGGRLLIRTRQVRSPDDVHAKVKLLIADTGSGIAPEMLNTMFEPFFSTKGEKGTGLGLWIVKGIVENHSGSIRVRSKPGQGTVFRVEIPVVR